MLLSSRMILYNITIIIEDSMQEEWLGWMNKNFVDRVMDTELFASSRLLKVLDSPNEGITYCIQFIADNISLYHQFKQDHEPVILEDLSSRFANRFVSFSTLMELID